MHQDDIIIFQHLFSAVDAIDVVGLVVERVVYEGVLQREVKGVAIVHQHFVIVASGHDNLFYPKRSQHSELPA